MPRSLRPSGTTGDVCDCSLHPDDDKDDAKAGSSDKNNASNQNSASAVYISGCHSGLRFSTAKGFLLSMTDFDAQLVWLSVQNRQPASFVLFFFFFLLPKNERL